jgi:hypothetical protein
MDSETANYRQLRLILKIRLLGHSQERLSADKFEGESLKSPQSISRLRRGQIQRTELRRQIWKTTPAEEDGERGRNRIRAETYIQLATEQRTARLSDLSAW